MYKLSIQELNQVSAGELHSTHSKTTFASAGVGSLLGFVATASQTYDCLLSTVIGGCIGAAVGYIGYDAYQQHQAENSLDHKFNVDIDL